jgi:exodeoxyribonuclease V beta subunit
VTTVRVRRPAALAEMANRHAVVEASAGTGKTYVLEHLVVDLLLRRQLELEQILVVTFTEKATAELVQRVRAKLGELKDLDPAHPLAIAGAEAPEDECWILDEAARRRLRAALLCFDRATITTIHGFCQRLLTEHAFLHQRLFDEEVVDEGDLFHAAFVETLRSDVAPDPALGPYLAAWLGMGKGLDRLERRLLLPAHRHTGGPYPRTGALRPPPLDEAALRAALCQVPEVEETDAPLAAELKRHGVRANSVTAVLRRLARLSRSCADQRAMLVAPTARGGKPLASFLAEIEGARKDDDILPWVCERLAPVPLDDSRAGRLTAAVRALAAVAVPLGAELTTRILPRLAARLETRKRQDGLYDFQDMLALVARALDGDGPRARALVGTLRARYRHALIDEFQDTDEVQWSIFRRVFLDSRDGHVLTVIGDPKQAIYSFRGADVHTYLRARSEILVAGGGEPVYLTANFRSTAPLIRAGNAVLDQGAAAPFFRRAGGIRYDHPVVCGRPELALAGAQAEAPVVVLDVRSTTASLYTWQVKQALLRAMVGELRAMLSPDRALALRGRQGWRPLGPADVYVLTRTIRESREVGDALRAARIPFSFFKQERLFATVEAREVLDLLRAIADPDDAGARARAFITAFFGLSLPDLASCEDLPPGHPLVRLLYEWRALADAGAFDELFARLVQQSGIVCRELFAAPGERRLTNYLHVLETLQREAALARSTLRELIQTLGAYVRGSRRPPGQQSDIQRLETDAAAVQVMTIHHAKGLEAPVVFVYGGFWPGRADDVRVFHDERGQPVVRIGRAPADEEVRIDEEQEDEERRVLYVALTRACARLYLPRYPAAFKQLRGSYRLINDRLDDLLGPLVPDEVRRLFAVVPVACPTVAVADVAPAAAALAAWSPPPALLAAEPDDGELRALAEARAGFSVTSYSAVKRRQGGFASDPAPDPAAGEEEDGLPPEVALPPDELPRGRLSGSFLHELLEQVPLEGLRERPPLPAWRARPEIAALFERLRRRHDRHPAHLPHAERLVHTALTASVRLGQTVIDGLATAARAVREMEFLYPIPETAPASSPFQIQRGVVKGFVDLLFEHDGRAYVCDWKGDWLAGWEAATVAAHSLRNYETQARLYTVAALRLLGIADQAAHERRFGGVLYCYLRGMRPDDPAAGIHFHRPGWDEVQAWHREMLGDRFWRLG